MEKVVFKKKACNGQRVDRFVAPRNAFAEMRRRSSWVASHEHQPVDIWYQKYLQKKKYTTYLDEAFGLEPLKTPESRLERQEETGNWPCVPRKKRLEIFFMGKTHCAPSFRSGGRGGVLDCRDLRAKGVLLLSENGGVPELLDWSNDNILVAALGRNYHKWSWRTQSLISQGFAQYDIQCCKFDPRGEMLILGTDMKMVEIHNNLLSKWVTANCCRCLKADDQYCSITALDWSPTGNSFATGCVRGMMVSFDRDARVISWRRVIRGALLAVRVSPDARYVAATAVSSPTVMVLTWPGLELVSSLNSEWTVRALTWHPWRSALLGIGAVTSHLHARIALLDAPSARVRDTSLGRCRYSLDAMLFSHRTGELVLSLWNADPAASYQKNCSHLVVMSDPETVVDRWGEGRTGLDRVRTMIFSPDGTKLATATAEEDLIIWNFLPEDQQKKKKTKSRRFSALPVYLDQAMNGYSLR